MNEEQFGKLAEGQCCEFDHTCGDEKGRDDDECLACGIRDCPHQEPLHYHHDGCPACYNDEVRS